MSIVGAIAAPAGGPLIGWGLLDLLAVIAFCFCVGLLYMWRHTIGLAFGRLARISILGHNPLGFLGDLNAMIESRLSQAAAAAENAMVYCFHKLIGIIIWTAQETAGLATDVYDAIKGAKHSVVNHITKVITHTVVKPIRGAVKVVSAVTKAQFNHLAHRVEVLAHRVAHVAHVGAGTIAAPFPRIGRLERTVKAQSRRLTRLEKLLAGGLGVALLLRAMARLGLGWLRCSNVNKTGKALCGMNPGLLEALLLDAAALTVTFNLVEFAEEMQTVVGEAAGLIHNWSS